MAEHAWVCALAHRTDTACQAGEASPPVLSLYLLWGFYQTSKLEKPQKKSAESFSYDLKGKDYLLK